MLFESPPVERLIEAFRRLPGVGKRSAERYALHLLSAAPEEAFELSEAARAAREHVTRCSECRILTLEDPCQICRSDRRDSALICVVEQTTGALAVEKGGSFRGRYHVLHGSLNPLDGVGPDELDLEALYRRLRDGAVREVIVATNATAEGEATALYLARKIGALGVDVSRIAHGVPMGSGLEYADDVTLSHALEGRTRM